MMDETEYLLKTLLKYDILKIKAEKAGITDLDSFLENLLTWGNFVSTDDEKENLYYQVVDCLPHPGKIVSLRMIRDNRHEVISVTHDGVNWRDENGKVIDAIALGWKPRYHAARAFNFDEIQQEPSNGTYYPADFCVPSSSETVTLKIVHNTGYKLITAYYEPQLDVWYAGDDTPVTGRIIGWKPVNEDARLLS